MAKEAASCYVYIWDDVTDETAIFIILICNIRLIEVNNRQIPFILEQESFMVGRNLEELHFSCIY